tara:strand:+ start:702 stop:917 length:216 start_codon:yes stop_codon:yes gene_type:complete
MEIKMAKAKTTKVSKKRTRARNPKTGHYIKDDPNTPNINEAYGEKPVAKNNMFGIALAVLLIVALVFLGGR